MEDRKRPSPYDQSESAPPSKKQATATNGATKSHADSDMPYKDDLERFQKDAIYRQMQEYKREKNTIELQWRELRKKARHHDDHLRIIDSWFKQMIDEVKILAHTDGDDHVEFSSIPSALLFSDQEKFEEHLHQRSKDIRSVMARIFTKNRTFTADVAELQRRLAQLLAAEKEHLIELEALQQDKDELVSRLENASLRYMMAEKKVDRAKSMTVAKLEKQALLGAQKPSEEGGPVKREESATNGVAQNGEELAEIEAEVNKLTRTNDKQKEQIEKLEEENASLMRQLTEASSKSTVLTDDECAKTELFKLMKSQHEDVIKRVNNLEALNIQLQEEAVRLQSERTAFKSQLETESLSAIAEKDSQLGAIETNLTRIRNNRDEIAADQAVKKASLEQDRDSLRKFQELCSAQETRIKALESENERLTIEPGNMMDEPSELDTLGAEELGSRYRELDRKYSLLNGELASMSTAFQKTSKLATQKVSEFASLEEKVIRLSAEKMKADQKYFSAMKSKETREGEVRTLRMQNTKSAEVVAQLKEAEAASRGLLANLEKQLAESKEALSLKTNDHRICQQQTGTHSLEVSRLNGQLGELKKQLTVKDSSLASISSSCRSAELEVEELRASLADTKKSLESWRVKGLGGQSEQAEMLRTIAYCNICKKDLKNTVIKTCGHTFCNNCVEERLTSRSRKCPNCGKSFGSNDHMRITL